MTEEELRALVRDTIRARTEHGGGRVPRAGTAAGYGMPAAWVGGHASHALFVLPAGADTEGPCLVEPTVHCNHCGYCKSYGH